MANSNYDPGQELSSIDFHSMIGGPLGAIVDAQAQSAFATVDFIKEVGFTPDTEDEATGEVTPGTPIYVNFKYPKMVEPYKPAVNGVIDDATGNIPSNLSNPVVVITGDGSGATAEVTATGDFNVINGGSGYEQSTTTVKVVHDGGEILLTPQVDDIAAVPAVFEEMYLEVPILTMMPIPFIRVEEGEIDFHAKITSMEYANVGSQFKGSASFSFSRNKGTFAGLGTKAGFRKNSSVSLKVNASYQRTTRKGIKVDKTYQLGVKVKVAQDEMPAGMEKVLGILEDAIVAQPV